MFDQLLSRKFHILRHQSGPYSEERQRYLSFLIQEGRSRSTLQAICGLLYSIAQLIPLDVSVTIPQIEAAADVLRSGRVNYWRGVVVCIRAIATVSVNLGDFSQLNFGCMVGHEAAIWSALE